MLRENNRRGLPRVCANLSARAEEEAWLRRGDLATSREVYIEEDIVMAISGLS